LECKVGVKQPGGSVDRSRPG